MKNLRLVWDHILTAQKINLMKLTIVKVMLCVFVLNIFAGVTEAQTPKKIAEKRAWTAYTFKETEARFATWPAPLSNKKANIKYGGNPTL